MDTHSAVAIATLWLYTLVADYSHSHFQYDALKRKNIGLLF